MSHLDEMNTFTDELTNAVQTVVETFQPYRADHRPECSELERWLIWNDKTFERLGIIALVGPEHALSLREKKELLRSRAMDLLRNAT